MFRWVARQRIAGMTLGMAALRMTTWNPTKIKFNGRWTTTGREPKSMNEEKSSGKEQVFDKHEQIHEQEEPMEEENYYDDDMSPKHSKKAAMTAILSLLGIMGGGALWYFGRPLNEEDRTSDKKESIVGKLRAYYRRAWNKGDDLTKNFTEPISNKLLPDIIQDAYQRPYTLVVDLEDTLIHAAWDHKTGWKIMKRPGADFFLAYLSQFFEIVVFSSQHMTFSEPVLNRLDPYGYVSHRLSRESTKYDQGIYIKDITHLNRDPSKVIIIDDTPNEVQLQSENAIIIKPYKADDLNDHALVDLIPFLEATATSGLEDVRDVLKRFQGKDIGKTFMERQKKLAEQLKENSDKPNQKKGLSRFFHKETSTPFMDFEKIQQVKYRNFLLNQQRLLKQFKEEQEALAQQHEVDQANKVSSSSNSNSTIMAKA